MSSRHALLLCIVDKYGFFILLKFVLCKMNRCNHLSLCKGKFLLREREVLSPRRDYQLNCVVFLNMGLNERIPVGYESKKARKEGVSAEQSSITYHE